MKMVNHETLRSFDNFKDQVFRSKVDNLKKNYRNKNNSSAKSKLNSISSIIPWRFFTRTSVLSGISYLVYEYHQNAIQYLLQKGHVNQIDFMVYDTILSDLSFRMKSFFRIKNENHINSIGKKQKFANKYYKSKLLQHFSYLNKTSSPYIMKSQVNSKWQIWVLGFQNLEKCIFLNEFGDVIERHQTSKIRLWNFPIWKRITDKIISIEPTLKGYQNFINSQQKSLQNPISQQIMKKCETINFLNKFSSNYQQIITECKQNQIIGNKIDKYVKNRLDFLGKIQKLHKQQNSPKDSKEKQNLS